MSQKLNFTRLNATRHGKQSICREVPAIQTGADIKRYYSVHRSNHDLEFAGVDYELKASKKDLKRIQYIERLIQHIHTIEFSAKPIESRKEIVRQLYISHLNMISSMHTDGYILGPVYRQAHRIIESYGHWLNQPH